MMNWKIGDVYRLIETTEAREARKYYQRDNQYIARLSDNEIKLYDTYYGQDGTGRNEEYLLTQGKLVFVCNLEDVEEINGGDLKYYDPKDYHNLSYQHNYYKKFVLRKGAERCPTAMGTWIFEKLKKEKRGIESSIQSIERLSVLQHRLSNGETDFYL